MSVDKVYLHRTMNELTYKTLTIVF